MAFHNPAFVAPLGSRKQRYPLGLRKITKKHYEPQKLLAELEMVT